MPFFPGERPLTMEEAASPDFGSTALSYFREQTELVPEQAAFSRLETAVPNIGRVLFYIARPLRSAVGPTQQRSPDPDTWWVFDADVDESEGWRLHGAIMANGLIMLPDGTECGGGFVMDEDDDEGDALGAEPPRPVPVPPEELDRHRQRGMRFGTNPPPMRTARTPQEALEAHFAERRRLPQGNSVVRDAVTRMRDLNVKDATFEDDASLDEVPIRSGFMRATESPRYQPELPAPVPPAPAVVIPDLNGNPVPLPPPPPRQKSVYDHLNENLAQVRAERPAPSVWDRLAAQRKSK